jgi:hypothetical protein
MPPLLSFFQPLINKGMLARQVLNGCQVFRCASVELSNIWFCWMSDVFIVVVVATLTVNVLQQILITLA